MKSNNFTGLYVANCVFQLLILSLIIYNINLWENRFLLYKLWTWFCSKQFRKPNLLEKNGKRSMVINGYFHLSRKVMIWSICGQRCGCTLNSTRNMYEYLNSGMKMAKHFIFLEGLQDSFQAEPTSLSKLFLVFFIGTGVILVMQFGIWFGCFGGSEKFLAWMTPVTSWMKGKPWQWDFIGKDSVSAVCHIDNPFTSYLAVPSCWFSFFILYQRPADILECLEFYLRSCFWLHSQGSCGSDLNFRLPLICSSLGLSFRSSCLWCESQNNWRQPKLKKDQGKLQ